MPKVKTHKGLLKRIRITKTGLVRHNKANMKHLRSHKSGTRLRRLRSGSYMTSASTRRLSRILARRLRGRNQPRSAMRRSPSPTERAARRAEVQKTISAALAVRSAANV